MALILIGSYAFHELIPIVLGYDTLMGQTQVTCWGRSPGGHWVTVSRGWRNGSWAAETTPVHCGIQAFLIWPH